ncbi:MAG: glycosyltransferase family 4 protein [Thermoguttaceae bacterium]|jgi:glycosyltransferase involved in cell wall biosynthesis
MRIVHLTAGAGPMYCGSCMYGNTLAAALGKLGADVVLVPVYTPLRTDEDDVSIAHLAYGGINAYLQQRSVVFRHTPWFVDRLLDHPALVRWAARRGARTRPEHLGALTVAMLRGQEGRLRKELEKLVRWLQDELRPDLVHLSNVMLSGLAGPLGERLGVPVISTLSGEDVFLEKLLAPHYGEARAELRRQASQLAALVAMNRYYADFMTEYLDVPGDRVHVIAPGLNLAGHGVRPPAADGPSRSTPFTIGYLARICFDKGLHQLVEAFRLLSGRPELPPARLRVAGYLDRADRPYLDGILQSLRDWGLSDRFQYVGELDRAAKIAFLQSLDVMSVPTVYAESKGLSVLEAWANGVPVVLPAHGAFPEMVADTGGGLLCEPRRPSALAAALAQFMADRQLAAQCGCRAQQAVRQRYHAELMARRMMELYENVLRTEPQ